jgi:CHASE2 domain-containing sensor protein/predicted Ser/Thr protein kinase
MGDEGSRLFDPGLIARRRLRRWVIGAVAVLLVLRLGAEVAPFARRPDLALLDTWQSIRATDHPSPQIAIVGIDEKSIGRFGPTPWPRNQYVPLIERLSRAGAKVIGLDITFGVLEREAANNELLAAAMKKAGNVVFGYEFTNVGDPSPPGALPSEALARNALPRFESPAVLPAPSLIAPEPVLAEAAAALGHVRTTASEDGRLRVLPLVIRHGDKAYPSLALQVARLYTGTPLQQVVLRTGVLEMGAWDIPVSAAGEVLLSWPAEGVKAFPQYSFLDVVRGDVPDDAFKDKAVLVAGTASGLDDRDFPYAVSAPGVLLTATFLDDVFRFDFVEAPTWAWVLEWGLFLAVCGLGVWLLPRLPTKVLLIAVPAVIVLLVGSAAFLYVQKGVWVKVVFPSLALAALMGLVVTLRLTASERETRDVAAEKLENQKLLALSFQEKGMLDMALATFNKLPFTEDMKLVYLNLGLDYENRGQRDKAFLVYKKVFDADAGFEDVAQRLERLSQAGIGTAWLTGLTGPQSRMATGATPGVAATPRTAATPVTAPEPSESPLSALVPTPIDADDAPTEVAPTPPGAGTPRPRTPRGGADVPTRAAPTEGPSPALPTHPVQTPGGRIPTPGGGVTGGGGFTPAPGGPVLPGALFGQRYAVEKHLGRGGMGDVYLVRDTRMDRRAALKTIRMDTDLDPKQVIELRQRFYREGKTAGQLTHPNIVTVYDVGEDLGMSYIVMEYVEGDTLAKLMKAQRLSVPQIKHVVGHAGTGLDYAHQNGIFHRDVKPDNIMVSKTGVVKMMDFGIARVVESDLTKTGSVMGTPAYMSPEQVSGEKIDGRSDIFSLGVILYELLTGQKPFRGDTMLALWSSITRTEPPSPSTVDAKVGTAWDEILRKALAKTRDDRYQTAREFVEAVKNAPGR